MNCGDLSQAIIRAPLAGWLCMAEENFLRLESPFRYPDGGTIELFVEERAGRLIVTDFGEAYRFLETHGIDPERSPARRHLIETAVRLGSASNNDGTLEIGARDAHDVLPAAQRLAQVISRVGDLRWLSRGSVGSSFSDVVEEFLRSTVPDGAIDRGSTVEGRATAHRVDIVVQTPRRRSAIESLSSASPTGANAQMVFTVAKFADISATGDGAPSLFVVLDNSADVWSEPIRIQLDQFATVIDWERRDDLVHALRGE